jgi:zinc transport system substrate-binding protein
MYRTFVPFLLLASPALADVPQVVTDIAPVHGLVSRVMDGVGEPTLLLPPGQSPHDYAMRPSDARKLQKAQVVFWMGESLTPWLEKPLSTLGDGAAQVELLEIEGAPLLEYAEDHDDEHDEDGHEADHDDEKHADGHDGEKHSDGHDEDHHDEDHADTHDEDEHGHDDDHAESHDEADHEEDHADAHGHQHHDGVDPHAWLDPEVARFWLPHIAQALADADPENAARYQDNAAAADQELAALTTEISSQLAPIAGVPFVAFHDAYAYLEHRFDLANVGTVAAGDASDPGAAHMVELRDKIAEKQVKCGFTEPQYDPILLKVAGENLGLRISELDPLGIQIELGPDYYLALLRSLADALTGCLAE